MHPAVVVGVAVFLDLAVVMMVRILLKMRYMVQLEQVTGILGKILIYSFFLILSFGDIKFIVI